MKQIELFFSIFILAFSLATPGFSASATTLKNALSKLSFKGRAAVSITDSQQDGSSKKASFEIPDARINFYWSPDATNTFRLRLNLSNGAAIIPDYYYLTSKDFIKPLQKTMFNVSARVGLMKLDFGEEGATNNRILGALPTPSAFNIAPTDEGIELYGKNWRASLSNGTSGVGSADVQGKAYMFKAWHAPLKWLYVSGSMYHSGQIKGTAVNSVASIAGQTAATSGTKKWHRRIWQMDAHIACKKGKAAWSDRAYSDSKVYLVGSLGQFHDGASQGDKRDGSFGMIEAMWNLHKKWYVASRFSTIMMKGDQTMALNAVANSATAANNEYHRVSFGAGYRWSKNTLVKFGLDLNKDKGGIDSTGTSQKDLKDNLTQILITTIF